MSIESHSRTKYPYNLVLCDRHPRQTAQSPIWKQQDRQVVASSHVGFTRFGVLDYFNLLRSPVENPSWIDSLSSLCVHRVEVGSPSRSDRSFRVAVVVGSKFSGHRRPPDRSRWIVVLSVVVFIVIVVESVSRSPPPSRSRIRTMPLLSVHWSQGHVSSPPCRRWTRKPTSFCQFYCVSLPFCIRPLCSITSSASIKVSGGMPHNKKPISFFFGSDGAAARVKKEQRNNVLK